MSKPPNKKDQLKAIKEAKEFFGLKKGLETYFDIEGRDCAYCGHYKEWKSYPVASKTTVGRASICRSCKSDLKSSVPLDRKKENYSARKNRKRLKKEEPFLLKGRTLRGSLMSRSRKDGMDRSVVPTALELKKWLEDQVPLTCYYTVVPVELFKCHIDHKIPPRRGGTHTLPNLCVCDPKANSAKGAMTEEEFKALINLLNTWEDKGLYLLSRLRMGHYGILK
jgi:hypothetical protein